jgi:hypothetical protein
MRVAWAIANEPVMYLRVLPALLGLSLIPLLLIIHFDLGTALFYPLALVSILSSITLAYLVGLVIGTHRSQR